MNVLWGYLSVNLENDMSKIVLFYLVCILVKDPASLRLLKIALSEHFLIFVHISLPISLIIPFPIALL